MYLFFEKDITDRDSYSSKTYSQVNNKYLWPKARIKEYYILRHKLDTNLYLDTRLLLEVDLEYPKESHELNNNYSLAWDKRKIRKKMLSG